MSKGKILTVSIVWLIILAIGVGIWKAVFAPVVEMSQAERERQEQARLQQEERERLQRGGSESHYRSRLILALDGFSGYAVFRSSEFDQQLRKQGIKLELTDDQANYPARLAALERGDTDMAVFTVDALVKTCAQSGDLPATIVAVIDETVGADAIVAYKQTIPNVDALNDSELRFVLTPNSPSETLARVVMSRFQLDRLSEDPFIRVQDPAEVVDRYKAARPVDLLAYVLWEPYVSQTLKNDRMHVVVDSSRFPSTIVDVLVASDDFLTKNRDVVKTVIECYLRANYKFRDKSARISLVMRDAEASHAPLQREEATRLVDGIWWKNTQENLAHMGQVTGTRLPHIEDMIANITAVLIDTHGLDSDPTEDHPNYLYNDSIWRDLVNFRPGTERETIRGMQLPKLTDAQWESLTPAGTARAPTLIFARGTDRLTERSRVLLDELANTLETTRYYVIVRGNASRAGDLEANKRLAEMRAKAVASYLVSQGVDEDRIKAVGVEPSGATSVSFVLGEPPY